MIKWLKIQWKWAKNKLADDSGLWEIVGDIAGSLIGGLFGSEAAGEAAEAQTTAGQYQLQATREALAQQERLIAPWQEAGENALRRLEERVLEGPGEFVESPGYKFVREQGLDAITKMMSPGQARSGAKLRAGAEYTTGLASTEYDNFLRRWYQSLTPEQSLAQVGMTAGQQLGQNALIGGQNLARAYGNIGSAQAAGELGQYNALARGLTGAGQNLMDYYNINRLTNALRQPTQLSYGQGAIGATPNYNWRQIGPGDYGGLGGFDF